MPEQLLIGFNARAAASQVAVLGRQVRSRVLWLVVSLVICGALWLWQRSSMTLANTVAMFGFALIYSLVWLVIVLVRWQRAKSTLAAMTPGVAVGIDRTGVWMRDIGIRWSEMAQIWLAHPRAGGSPVLGVRGLDGTVSKIGVMSLDAEVGTIDSAIQAYSGGSWRIDSSKLGN
ncbi:MAG: hypothetical protein LBV00_09195 [Propionibacteriaceae bacterium]|jgi:hypothetical protein|nr:hypothetical protein [Propionibacteriaceae bacterium]